MKVFVLGALEAKLRIPADSAGEVVRPRWRSAFGSLRHRRKELRAVQDTIDKEFGKINPDDWK